MRILNLLWALPIALFAQYYAFVGARIGWCGLRDCHGVGSALNDPDVASTLGMLLVGALVSTTVLVVAPWTKRVVLRFIAPPVFAVAVAVISFIVIANPAFGLS